MTNIQFRPCKDRTIGAWIFDPSLDLVPDDNMVNDLEDLCIRPGNPQFTDCQRKCEDPKKSGRQNGISELI